MASNAFDIGPSERVAAEESLVQRAMREGKDVPLWHPQASVFPSVDSGRHTGKGTAFSVTRPPEIGSAGRHSLDGTSVVDRLGRPRRMYHGTLFNFEQFQPLTTQHPNSLLYGPGYYFTESPSIAQEYLGPAGMDRFRTQFMKKYVKEFGINDLDAAVQFTRAHPGTELTSSYNEAITRDLSYAELGPWADQVKKVWSNGLPKDHERFWVVKEGLNPAPQVRMHYLDIRKPFDIDAAAHVPMVQDLTLRFRDLGSRGPRAFYRNNDDVYAAAWEFFKEKDKVNDWIKSYGFDGITHVGGYNVGDQFHRVHIAFDPSQIKSVGDATWSGQTAFGFDIPVNPRSTAIAAAGPAAASHPVNAAQLAFDFEAAPSRIAQIAETSATEAALGARLLRRGGTLHAIHTNLETKIGGWLKRIFRLPFKPHSRVDPMAAATSHAFTPSTASTFGVTVQVPASSASQVAAEAEKQMSERFTLGPKGWLAVGAVAAGALVLGGKLLEGGGSHHASHPVDRGGHEKKSEHSTLQSLFSGTPRVNTHVALRDAPLNMGEVDQMFSNKLKYGHAFS